MRTSTKETVDKTSRITGKKEKEFINVKVKVEIIKNKVDKPWLSGPIYIKSGEGIDNIASIVELAINTNVIKKSGAFYGFDHEEKSIFYEQGKENLRALLERDTKILDLLSRSIKLKEDEDTKKQAVTEDENVEGGDDLMGMLEQTSKSTVKTAKAKKEAVVVAPEED